MKNKTFTLCIFLFFSMHLPTYSQVCDCSDEDSGLSSELRASDGFESYASNAKISIAGNWSVFPFTTNYFPAPATVVSSNSFCGNKSLRFQYANNTAEDMLYEINGWRTTFSILIPAGKAARLSYLNEFNTELFHIYFMTSGLAIIEKGDLKLGSFNYNYNSWQRFSIFTEGAKWEVFLGDDHVASINNTNGENARKLNLYAHLENDLFYVDKLCHLRRTNIFITCLSDFTPVCLNKSNSQVGANECNASVAGYLNKEFHLCNGGPSSPCDKAMSISCGQTLSSTTKGESFKFYRPDYGNCLPQNGSTDFRAPDKVFKFTKPDNTGDLAIHLWGKTRGVDLDVFLLDKCGKSWAGGNGGGNDYQIVLTVPPGNQPATEVRCIASGISTVEANGFDNDFINIPDLPAGEYYIVVDGQHWKENGYNDDAGDFDLSLTCFDLNCNNATPILCDIPLNNQSNANGLNNVSVYCSPLKQASGSKDPLPMGAGCTGNEKVYTYKATKTGDITINLTGVDANEDFDLFVFSNCNHTSCLGKSTTRGNGINESITLQVTNGNTYYIVVDGYRGTVGTFNLAIQGCNLSNPCLNAEIIPCGSIWSRSTLNSFNQFTKSDYTNCVQTNSTFDGNDKVFKYSITNQFPIPTVALWGFSGDLDLFILSECGNPAKCVKSSTNPTGNYEYIDMKGLPIGDYYIVVDGPNASQKSDFKISVACQPGCNDPATTNLICNTSVVGNTAVCEINFINKYSCDTDYRFSGPECYYHFTAPEAGEYTFDLFGFGNKNLDLFILDYTNCNSTPACIKYSANNIPGQAEQVKITLAKNQLITVVVDGSFGDGGEYALTTLCPGFATTKLTFDIDDNICDAKGKTIQVPVKVLNFNNIRSFQMSLKSENSSIVSIKGINSSALSGVDFIEIEAGKTFNIFYNKQSPLSLPDGSTAFFIEVELKGNVNQSSKLFFTNSPLDIKAGQFVNNVTSSVPVEIKDGSSCIVNTTISFIGKITNAMNAGINNVIVKLSGLQVAETKTNTEGNYSFANLTAGSNYIITPEKNVNANNGLDIFDLSFLQDLIIGRTLVANPYKLLAADINKDGSLDIFDLGELQDIIIGRKTTFSNNTSWVFLPKSENLTIQKVNSNTYAKSITINIAAASRSDLDFYGVKIGDLVEDANPKDLTNETNNANKVEVRSVGSFSIQFPELKATKDQIIYVPVTLAKFKDIRAFQFNVSWNNAQLEYLGIDQFSKDVNSFNENNILKIEYGKLNVVWLNNNNLSLPDNTKLFYIKFKVLGNKGNILDLNFEGVKATELAGPVSNIVSTNGKVIISDVSTSFYSKAKVESAIRLFPNPAPNYIIISSPSEYEFVEISDLNGRIVYSDYGKHKNQNNIDLSLYASGVYILKIKIKDDIYYKKFVKE